MTAADSTEQVLAALAMLEQRYEATTPGEWMAVSNGIVTLDDETALQSRVLATCSAADAEFIVAAYVMVPLMIDELRRQLTTMPMADVVAARVALGARQVLTPEQREKLKAIIEAEPAGVMLTDEQREACRATIVVERDANGGLHAVYPDLALEVREVKP